jgi:hypothetical protein
MRQMMRAMGQKEMPEVKPTRSTPITKSSKNCSPADNATAEHAAWLLFDQALLLEDVPLNDPTTFVQRFNRVLSNPSGSLRFGYTNLRSFTGNDGMNPAFPVHRISGTRHYLRT